MPDWLDTEAPLVSHMLRNAGYRTAHYGKWHLANDMIVDSPTPAAYGFDDYGAFNCSGEQMPWHEDAQRASAFIADSVKQGKPFFINVWMHEPHTPFHTVPMYEWRFRHLQREDQIYASVLSHADDRVGDLLDTLDRLKVADKTLVIFSSDNGPARNTAGRELSLMYDTATGAGWGIAGAAYPDGYAPDGVSVLEVLAGKTMASRNKPLFWKKAGASAWAVVHGRWKLRTNRDLSQIELYDIAEDVGEENNLMKDKPEVVQSLLAQLKAWQATLPDKPAGHVFSELRKTPGAGAKP